MDKTQNALVVAEQPKKGLMTKLGNAKAKVGTAMTAGAVYAMTAMPAHADGDLSSVGTAFTDQLTAAKGIALTLFAAGAVVLGLFVGWKYIKRAGSSA